MQVAGKNHIRFMAAAYLLIAGPGASAHAAPPEGTAKTSAAESKPPDFDNDVAPIFQAKCLKCHGEKDRKAELDLRSLSTLLKGGESGAVVVPKDPDKSLLYEKV